MNGTVVNWLGVSPHLAHIAAGRRNRRGVSLMEVLISIFVLSIGLMGVAALIPVGRFSIVETGKADRSAACGRAALREIKVRRMLQRKRPAMDDPSVNVPMQLPEFTSTSSHCKFDFGTSSSPLESDYALVTKNSVYPVVSGLVVYGWTNGTIYDHDRQVGSDLETDFNYTKVGTFVVDVPPGTYHVTVTVGDLGKYAHDQMGIFLEGELKDTVSTPAWEVSTDTYEVTVSDGQLTVLLDDLGGSDEYVVIEAMEVDIVGVSDGGSGGGSGGFDCNGDGVGDMGNAATVIDPLCWARYLDRYPDQYPDGAVKDFPYCIDTQFDVGWYASRIPRLTLRAKPLKSDDSLLSLAVADRLFTWQDDIVFDMPEDSDERPKLLVDGTGVRPIEGNYSWMVMVTPSPGDKDLCTCTVSVVVFYKRNLDAMLTLDEIGPDNPKPSERVAVATFLGGGFGGGDVELAAPEVLSEPTDVKRQLQTTESLSEYLSLKENTWLMLCNDTRFIWYRVVAVADELTTSTISGRTVRLVTLAGPDWKPGWCVNLDTFGGANDAQAVLCDEVVGVYTQTVDLDTAEAWSR